MLNCDENNTKVKDEEMPKKKGVKVKPHKRRKPGGARKTVKVKGYSRALPGVKPVKPKFPKRKTRKRRKR